ncbi:ADP-ribosylglycohydrolase family protein [Mongoliibacter ruber]|uniref:ADP-ribosylglycohydrolase n=1 Tax=Mongoliibacter ruber TaxID=1750599 RepID=A0A2T0WKA8_9BACT|nr:ADP-ribosylglycohydrolase family protein [Mongoliibacter ruber]PRY87092.1 ADP-ribosylglycohydrolase [Mongoliibacter ruber]
MIAEKERLDKYLGCLLGGAIGDALGAPIEFLSYESILARYGANGVQSYVEYTDGKGEFTDDTQMLLFTAEGALRAYHRGVLNGIGGALTQITYHSYLRWLKTQSFPLPKSMYTFGFEEGWLIKRKELFKRRYPGNTCLNALQSGEMGSVEKPINDSKGCGTVMRIAPIGLIFYDKREYAFNEALKVSAITHGHPSGYLSGGLLASIIADLSNGIRLELAIQNGLEILEKLKGHEEMFNITSRVLEIHRQFEGRDISEREIKSLGEGWVAEEALAISLLCALHYPNDFKKAVLTSINHSGDSDSTGAITGNLVGLIVGKNQIPQEWIDNLMCREIVEEVAHDLFIKCPSLTVEVDKAWHDKYPGY